MLICVKIWHNGLVLVFIHLLLLVGQVLLVVITVVVVVVPAVILLVVWLHIPVLISTSIVLRSSVVVVLLGVIVPTLTLEALIICALFALLVGITLLIGSLAKFRLVICCMIVFVAILIHSIHTSIQSKQSLHHADRIFTVKEPSFNVVNLKIFYFPSRQYCTPKYFAKMSFVTRVLKVGHLDLI